MKMTGAGGHSYYLADQPMKSGGEGSIYPITNAPGKVAKIYKPEHLSAELEAKLTYMVQHPPNGRVILQVAWPLELLYDAGRFVGFVMPKLHASVSLKKFYEYPQINYKHLTTEHRATIAANICVVVEDIHSAGYIFGDFNPNNIGVNPQTGEVSFFDVDTYQFRDPSTGHTYRCMGGFDGYVAPELLHKLKVENKGYGQVSLPSFTEETDNFALAIHVFRLLMNGFTPFCGIPENGGSSASPGLGHKAVEQGNYCFRAGYKPFSPAMTSADTLTPEILRLCAQAFLPGTGSRPKPLQWKAALERMEQEWIRCGKDGAHYYRRVLPVCPYCDADQRLHKAANPNPIQRQFQTPPQPAAPPNPGNGGLGWRRPPRPYRKGVHWVWIVLLILVARIVVQSISDAQAEKKARQLQEVQEKMEQMMLEKELAERFEEKQQELEAEAAEAERAADPIAITGDSFYGTLADESQIDYFTYQAPCTGMYRFDCLLQNNMNNGYYLYLWGPDDRHMETEFYREGISAELQEGEIYRLEVRAGTIREACDYDVKIGIPNPVQTVNGNVISGKMTYQDQEDWHLYQATGSGLCYLQPESSNPDGYFQYSVFDDRNVHIGTGTNAYDGLVDLKEGEIYRIRVRQTKGQTNYRITMVYQE